jgi:creatinine amidohydrolase
MTLLRWAEMDRDKVGAVAAGGVVALPLGAVEQHGPHLPTGTDVLIATHVVDSAARKAGRPVLVLPALPFGLSNYHSRWGATVTVGAATLLALLGDVAASVRDCGAGQLFIVNGHGGNRGLCATVSLQMSTPDFKVHGLNYWDLAPEVARAIFTADQGSIGHAGQAETAIVAAVFPELCGGGGRVPHEAIGPALGATAVQRLGASGVSGDPAEGSAERGARFIDEVVRRLAALFDGTAAAAPGQPL